MDDKTDGEVVLAKEAGAVTPRTPLTVDEIQLLEQKLAPLTESYPAPPVVVVANTAIGVADELGRLVLSFVLVCGLLIALAIGLSPWVWIAVAVWTGFAVATILWFRHRGLRRPTPQISSITRPQK